MDSGCSGSDFCF